MPPNIHPLSPALVIGLILAAFAFVGRGDYEQALEVENARLKAQAAHCKAANAEAQAARYATRGGDLAPALPRGMP